MEWLLNLEKYSKIKDYTLSQEDSEKIWDVVGGSMWGNPGYPFFAFSTFPWMRYCPITNKKC